jgi:RHS repeat-associated protein
VVERVNELHNASVTPRRRHLEPDIGHEEIDPVELVHMNGRVCDREIGRFLPADPFVQDQTNSQSFNRYAYVLNSRCRRPVRAASSSARSSR